MSAGCPHVVVVGGGATGLAAAFYLQHPDAAASGRADGLRVTVLEAAAHPGGSVQTLERRGCVIEAGPDSLLLRGEALRSLVRATDLAGRIVAPRSLSTYVYRSGKLHRFPAGTVLGVPARVLPFLRTRLVSPAGKLRALWDFLRRDVQMTGDEAVGTFLRRRLGDAVVDGLVAPLLEEIHNGDIDRMSLLATSPFFLKVRGAHRSLLFGARATLAARLGAGGADEDATRRAGPVSFAAGMQSLIEGIVAQLPSGTVHTHAAVQAITRCGDQYQVTVAGGAAIHADAVILAVPAPGARAILGLAEDFGPLGQASPRHTTLVTLGLRTDEIDPWLPGTGVLVPPTSGCTLSACSWSHLKWPHVAPPGQALLRCYVRDTDEGPTLRPPDDVIAERARQDLERILGIRVNPEFHVVTHCARGISSYAVGHLADVRQARSLVAARYPRVVLAGASYAGVAIPDCVEQGRTAARQAIAELESPGLAARHAAAGACVA